MQSFVSGVLHAPLWEVPEHPCKERDMGERFEIPLVILRLNKVKARTGLSRSGIYQKMADGEFPESISLGLRAVGWLESEVDQWLADMVKVSRSSKNRAVQS